jgi:isopentenyldiphosphate isomerase
MEMQIVNEKDEIIGYKKRGTLNPEDIYRVSALWIKNSKEKFLLAKRVLTKKRDPGLWGPAVAGTVEKGETYEANIIKESKEELGLTNIHPKKFVKTRVIHPHNHFTQWFLLKLDKEIKDFKIQKDEVAKIKWVSKKELFKLINKDSKELIKSLKLFVKKFIMKNE